MTAATISAPQLAAELGVSRMTVHRWATDWYGPSGRGTPARWRLSRVDVMVARAWQAINEQCDGRVTARARAAAAEAIRRSPRSCLLVVPATGIAVTYDSLAEAEAGDVWLRLRVPFAMLIQLDAGADR